MFLFLPSPVVTKPPYEITETGWGEFEIIIKIFFIDPNERPVTLYHLLKLFQSDTNAMLGKKTVVSEFYDEMVDFIMRGLSKTLRVWCGGQSTALGVVLSFRCVGWNSALRLGSKHLHLLSVLAHSCSEF